jgi:hypothetical protein
VSRLESFDRGAQKGAAFGGSDEAAGVRAMLNTPPMVGPLGALQNLGFGAAGLAMEAFPGQPPESYTRGRDIQRRLEGEAQSANPVTSLVGEIAGSVVVPVGGTARAATKTGQIAKGVGIGAATGGAYGFASEDGSLEDRAKAGLVSAGLGGAFGGALSTVIPRDIPLGDVLNAEIFGTKVERPVLKTIERMLVQSGVSPNDIAAGMVQIRNRLQSGDVGAGLPSRFKDELVNQFGDKARGVRDAIENQIRGGAVRSGSASDTAVRAAVSEDNAAARELFERSVDQLAGSTNRPELRGQALDQLQEIVETQYKPILAQPIADPAKQQRLMSMLEQPRMKALAAELAEDAEREGIDLAALMARNPAEAAHWMQSKARQLADDRGTVTITGRVKPDRIMSNRRQDILDALEDAVPGYRETRMEYGDKFGVMQAVNFAKGFMNRAKDDVSVADMAEEFANMSAAQKQMALASVRSVLQGSAGNVRYVDPELGTAALRTAEIGKEPVLKALSEVFGEQGTKVADDIKAIVTRTDANRRINPQATGSDTMPKAEAAKFAINNTRGPIQRFVGNMLGGLPVDLTASAFTGGPTPLAAGRAGIEGAGKLADKRALTTVDKVTELLLAKPQNALAASAPTPSIPPSSGGAAIIDQLSTPSPNALAPQGPVRAAGFTDSAIGAGIGSVGGSANDLNNDGKKDWQDALIGGLGGLAAVNAPGAIRGARNALASGGRTVGRGADDVATAGGGGPLQSLFGKKSPAAAQDAALDVRSPYAIEGDELSENYLQNLRELKDRMLSENNPASAGFDNAHDANIAMKQMVLRDRGYDYKSRAWAEISDAERASIEKEAAQRVMNDIRAMFPERSNSVAASPASPILTAGAGGKRPPKPDSPEAIKAALRDMAKAKPEPTRLEQMVDAGKDAAVPPAKPGVAEEDKLADQATRMLERGDDVFKIHDKTGVVMIPYNNSNIPLYAPQVGPEETVRMFYEALRLPANQRPEWVRGVLSQAKRKSGLLLTDRNIAPPEMVPQPPANALANLPPERFPVGAVVGGALGGAATGIAGGVAAIGGYQAYKDEQRKRNALAQ